MLCPASAKLLIAMQCGNHYVLGQRCFCQYVKIEDLE